LGSKGRGEKGGKSNIEHPTPNIEGRTDAPFDFPLFLFSSFFIFFIFIVGTLSQNTYDEKLTVSF